MSAVRATKKALLSLLLSISAPAAACQLSAVAVLPLTQEGAPFVISAEVNGHPARLRLDTGSTRTTLDLGSAQRMGVHMHISDRQAYGMGGVQRTSFATVDRLRIDRMKADQWPMAGRDLWPGGSPDGLDGYLAMDMLAAYDLDLDAPGHHLVVYDASGDCRAPTVALAQPLYAVPLVLIDQDRQAVVDIEVNGRRVRALLDSGMAHSTMFRIEAERLGIDLARLHAPGHAVMPGIGARAVAMMPHAFDVQVGDLRFNNLSIDVLDQADTGMDRHRTGSLFAVDELTGGHQMTLGADFMRRVHLWISHSSHRLIMQYPPQPSALPH